MQITDYYEYKTYKVSDVYVNMHDSGMLCSHNYSCPVCRTNHAVLDLNSGLMQPCWSCQELGYTLIRKENKKSFLYKIKEFFKILKGDM